MLTAGCSSDEGGGGGGGSGGNDTASPSRTGTQASPSAQATEEAPPAKGSVKVVRTVTEDLKTPWGLAPLPDGDLLVSSRDEGTITRVDTETGKKTVLGEVPGVSAAGEGGLLGLALSPSFASDHMVYAYFTTESDNRIARLLYEEEKPAGEQLGAPNTVFRGIPKGYIHNGGRIAFGPDKMLYAGTGESGDTGLAQDKSSLGGKILRLTPEGEPAPGNPFPIPRCTRTATAMCRASPGTPGSVCSPRSSARTPGTSSTRSSRATTTAGPRRRATATTPRSTTLSPSGTRTTRPPAASPTPGARYGWRG